MKILTTNFLTCAVKACKSSPASFPLHFKDAVLERTEIAYNALFMMNILPRLHWDALRTTATELGLAAALPVENPSEVLLGWGGKERDLKDRGGGGDGGVGGGGGAAVEDEDESAMEVEVERERSAVPGGAGGEARGEGKEEEKEEEEADVSTGDDAKEEVLKKLHGLLLETAVSEGKLVCGNCGFEYPIKDGVGNFLLPPHLV